MDNRQLSNFLAIVEEGNISKAAERLHLAQPYLSHQLKLLEEELGVKLVDRTTRRFQITEAGMVLSYRARQMLDLSEATIKELKDFDSGFKGSLSIGCLTSLIETLLTEKIYEFNKLYPEIDFEVRQYSTIEILELLKRGIIEIGIIRSPLISPDIFESIALPMEPMLAAVSSEMKLKSNGKSISLEELAEIPLLVHRRYERDIIDLFKSKGLEPRILCKIEDTRPLLMLASKGMGAAIIPKDWTSLVPGSNLVFKTITGLNMDTGTIIVWLKDHYLTLAVRHFLKYFP
ncbi:MAG: LysR family transcriptional regulator [Solirubrobacterales bacterium]